MLRVTVRVDPECKAADIEADRCGIGLSEFRRNDIIEFHSSGGTARTGLYSIWRIDLKNWLMKCQMKKKHLDKVLNARRKSRKWFSGSLTCQTLNAIDGSEKAGSHKPGFQGTPQMMSTYQTAIWSHSVLEGGYFVNDYSWLSFICRYFWIS